MLATILLLAAFILLLLAAFGVSAPKVHLGWLGLSLVVLSQLVPLI